MSEIKTDDKLINHVRNVKLLQAIHSDKKFFVECFPTDTGARRFPDTNFAVKEIELPNFDLFEEKLGYKWIKEPPTPSVQNGEEIFTLQDMIDAHTNGVFTGIQFYKENQAKYFRDKFNIELPEPQKQ